MITRIFSFGRGVLCAGLLFTVLAGVAVAQTIDRPMSAHLRIVATIYPPVLVEGESPSVTLTLPEVADYNGQPVSRYQSGEDVFSFDLDADIQPGRLYKLDVQAYGAAGPIGGVLELSAPRGYTIEIDGEVRSVISEPNLRSDGFYHLRVIAPKDTFSGRAGVASSITSGKVFWQVGLGSMLNGHPAGSLTIADGATEANWDQIVTPAGLSVHAPRSSEIYVFPPNDGDTRFRSGEIWQVVTNEAFVEVVPNAARTSYELKFYNRDSTTRTEGTGELNGHPYVSYQIEKDGGATRLKITRTDYDSEGADYPGRMVTKLARTTPDAAKPNDFQWTLEDWHKESAVSVPVVETRNWEIAAGVRAETIVTATGATPAVVASRVRKEFQSVELAEELVHLTRGQTATNPADEYYGYNRGFSKKTSGDSWEVYNYATNNRVSRVRRPFQNGASGPTQSADLTTFASASTEETLYAYENNIFDRVNLIETRVGGTLTSKTTVSYSDPVSTTYPPHRLNTADGKPYTTATRREKTGSATTAPELVTVTKYFSEDVGDPFYRDQIHSIQRPDGTITQFVYNRGMFDDGGDAFALVGPDARTVAIHGTTSSEGADELTSFTLGGHTSYTFDRIYVVRGKSTAEVLIRHGNATLWWQATYVWEGADAGQGWKRVSYTKYDYDYANRLVECTSNGAVVYSANYDQGRLVDETDASGVKTTYTTDDAGRIRTATKTGVGAIVDLTTTFTYDADGRVVEESTRGAGSNETLVVSRVFDDAGRLKESYVPGQTGRLKTEYYYEPANRRVVVTLPGGGTKELQYYEDGRLDRVTGSAVVPTFYTFATTTEGLRHALVRAGSATSARTQEVWTDWLGRTVRTSRPGFSGPPQQAAFEESYFYDDAGGTGRLSQISRTGYADTLFSYDRLSNVTRTRWRKLATTTEAQSPTSADRITDFERGFENTGGAWWFAERVRTYPIAGDATTFLLSTTQHRLTGLSSSLRGEVIATDADRNRTETTTTVDRSNTSRTVAVSTVAKNSGGVSLFGSSGQEVFTNGLPTSRRGFDGLTYTATYDALSRPFSQSDPRTGATWTYYYSGSGLVERISAPVTDSGTYGDVATYTYDSAGRTASVANARGDTTRFAYNPRNQVVRRWGTGTHPASFGYNDLGEAIALRTFRNTAKDFSGQNWPLSEGIDPDAWDTSNPATWDKTTWSFDAASGLLATKTYHDAANAGNSRSVDFTYNARGQVATRQWARRVGGGSSGDRVTATYAYLGDGSGEFKTGELREITYNDGSAPVRFEYTRAGQMKKVWDATGSGANEFREFGYHDAVAATDFQPFRLDAIEFNAFYGERVFTPRYDGAQRAAGFYLGNQNALPGSLSAELTQALTFNTAGRLEHIDAAQGSASARRFTYGYVSDSALVQTLTSGSFVATRGYEEHRDLLTNLDTTWSGVSRTRYEHTFNEAGQRKTTRQSGSAFTDFGAAVFSSHVYSSRGELTDSASYLGDDSAAPQLSGRHFAYSYDLSGNRIKMSRTGSAGADTYVPGVQNRYASRQNHYAHLAGTVADSGVAVSLRQGDYEPPIGRQGAYWAAQVPLDNNAAPAKGNVTVTATKPAANSSAADIVNTQTRAATIPPALQAFIHDEDGNLQDDTLGAMDGTPKTGSAR